MSKRSKWRLKKHEFDMQKSFTSEKIKCPHCKSNKIKDYYKLEGNNPENTYVMICEECNKSYYVVIKINTKVSIITDIVCDTKMSFKVKKEWPYNITPKLWTFWEKYLEDPTVCYKWFTPE